MAIWNSGRRGQSLVELALLMPILLWLCAGIVDFARVYYYDVAAVNAARSGARVGADYQASDATIKNAVLADAGSRLPITGANRAVDPSPSRAIGGDVKVTVTYSFTPITPLIGNLVGGTLTVTRSSTMAVIY
jgi:Flp pilus assembly protein TadG